MSCLNILGHMSDSQRPAIAADFESDRCVSFRNKDSAVDFAALLRDKGLSRREAAFVGASMLDPDVMQEDQNVHSLGRALEIDRSTARSHISHGRDRVRDGFALRFMCMGDRPKRVIGHFDASSHVGDGPVDELVVTLARYEDSHAETRRDDAGEDAEEYTLVVEGYERHWNDATFHESKAHHVQGRRRVVAEVKRILRDHESKANPVTIVAEVMHALGIESGPMDVNGDYSYRHLTPVDPLNDPESPPEGFDTAPTPNSNLPSVVNRRDSED